MVKFVTNVYKVKINVISVDFFNCRNLLCVVVSCCFNSYSVRLLIDIIFFDDGVETY